MEDLNFPYKFKKFIKEYGKEIEEELNEVVESKLSSKNTEFLYVTDLENLCEIIIDNYYYSEEFYINLIKYCKYLVEDMGYYSKIYNEEFDKLNDLADLDRFNSDKFRPMIHLFKSEKYLKRDNAVSEGCKVGGALIGLLTMFTES